MDKNEILKRSQTENILGDEREKQIRLESDTFSLIFMLAVTLILTTVNYVKGLSADGFLAIFWASIRTLCRKHHGIFRGNLNG